MDRKHLKFGLILAVLIAAVFWTTSSHALNNSSLKGPYSVLLTSAAGWTPSNMVGVLNFDGAGNVTGTFQSNIDGTLGSATASGTYSVGAGGTGTMTLTLSTGPVVTYAMAVEASAKQIEMIVSNVAGETADVIAGSAISQGVTLPYTFTDASLKGTYGLALSKIPLDQSNGGPSDMAGTLTFDGKGNIKSGAGTQNENGGVAAFTSTGTYSVNADGTGTIVLDVSGGLVVNFAIALNSDGRGFQLIELTTNSGGRNDVIGGSASR